MQKLKYDYSAEYIPDWGKTILNIIVYYSDDVFIEFTSVAYGDIIDEEDEVDYHLDYMYNMATDTGYHRTHEFITRASY